jgi:uncharacterized protein YegL
MPAFSNEFGNKIFDENRTTALDLSKKEYQRSKVLFIGLHHHYSHQHIEQLAALLKEVGHDSNFKAFFQSLEQSMRKGKTTLFFLSQLMVIKLTSREKPGQESIEICKMEHALQES